MGVSHTVCLLISILPFACGLQCFLCGNNEPSNFCNATTFATSCTDDSQVCHVTVTNVKSRPFSTKGCIAKTVCQQRRSQNGPYCSEGVVTPNAPSCTFCCTGDNCNRDAFNYGVVRTTTTAPLFPTRRPAGPAQPGDLGRDVEACLDDYRKLVKLTVAEPAQHFPTLCRELPFILFCLSSQDEAQRKMSREVANHLWALCPRDCDVTAGDNCTSQFVSDINEVIVFGAGDQCGDVQREVGQYVSCLDYNVGSCEGATAQRFALTLQSVKRESDTLCVGNLKQLAPTPPSESADCEAKMATKRVSTLTTNILEKLYGGHDVSEFCKTDIPSTEKYLEGALASCSDSTTTRVRSALQIPKNLLGLSCDTVTPPPLCDVTEARKCIVDFWTQVDDADDAHKYCSLIAPTEECVERLTMGCDDKQRDELKNLLQIFLNRIGDMCDEVIDPNLPCGQTIKVIEGGPGHRLQFKMVKSPKDLCKGQGDCNVYLDLVIQNVAGPKCPDGADTRQLVCKEDARGQPCSRHITDATWRQGITFHLLAAVDNQKDGDVTVEVQIVLRIVSGGDTQKRTLCIVEVFVIDADRPAMSDCASSNDPHLHTFDKWYYNNHMQGLFLMYKNKDLPYEVQAIFQPCGNNRVTCNCGLAIRSGDFVFVTEMCRRRAAVCDKNGRHVCNRHGQLRMYTYGDVKDPAMKIFKQGLDIEVILPHGTRISIHYDKGHQLFNFVIYPSIYDWGTNKTEGLCGNYDGVKNNDLTTSTGDIYRPTGRHHQVFPDRFSASWRLPKSRSLFGGISGSEEKTPKYCPSTTMGDTSCDVTGLVEYCHLTLGQEVPLPRMTVKPNVQAQNGGRNKREVDTNIMDIIEIQDDNNTSPISTPVMPEAEARTFCQNYLNEKEEWSQLCLTLPNANNTLRIQPCIDDLMATGDKAWADTALEGFKHDCMTQLTRDAEYLETFDGRRMKERIMALTCPNMCSGNGLCTDGKCHCQAPYTGSDCSVSPQTTVPQFLNLFHDGLCDVTRGNCSNVVLFGTNFVDSPSLICHFVGMEVHKNGSQGTGKKFEVKGTFISDNQILCPTPALATPGGKVAWTIDVSNDGVNPSLSPVFLVSRDPRCAHCAVDATTRTATCQRMESTCIIDNSCYTDGERNPFDSCQRCDPSHSTTEWNNKTLCTLNIAALIICLLLLFLLIAALVYCFCRFKDSCQKGDKSASSESTNFAVAESKPVKLTQR